MELKTIFRIVELVICVVLFIIWYAMGMYAFNAMIVCGTVFGYLIITAVMVALEFAEFQDTLVFTIIGAILFLVCAGFSLAVMFDNSYGDYGNGHGRFTSIVAAALFVANGIIFLIDFIMEVRQ